MLYESINAVFFTRVELDFFIMSWLSDLAKGAEALLEKVDQSTASALQKDNYTPQTSSYATLDDANESSRSTAAPVPDATDLKAPNVQNFPGIFIHCDVVNRELHEKLLRTSY